jgi:hypothetical protein
MAIVYQHIRLDKNEVFYVGISSNYRRAYEKADRRNIIWGRIAKKTDYKVEFVAENISWEDACKLEIELIKKNGRLDLGNGTLANLTNGGDGSINRIQTEEEKIKRANSLRGLKRTNETKQKISLAHLGKVFSKETLQKMSDSHKGQITKIAKMVIDLETGIFFDSLKNACYRTNKNYKNQFYLMSKNSIKSRFTFI